MIGKRHLLWLGRAFVFVFLTSSVFFNLKDCFNPGSFFSTLCCLAVFVSGVSTLMLVQRVPIYFFLVIPALFHKVFSQILCFCCLPVLGRFLCPESGWN